MKSCSVAGLLLVVAMAAGSTVVRAAEPPVAIPGEREMLTLSNGLKVLLCRDTLVNSVDVAVWYDAGVRREPQGKSGLAALCQRLMFTGGSRSAAGDHLRRIEAAGGRGGAMLSGDYACYHQTVPEQALELALEREASRMGTLTIDAAGLDKARQALRLEERQSSSSTPVAVGIAALYGTAFRDHPYGHSTLGDETAVGQLTPAEVQTWYRNWYRPGGNLVTIVGRFEIGTARALVRKHLEPVRDRGRAEMAGPPAEPDPTGERRSVRSLNVPFRAVFLGFRGPGAGEAGIAPLLVLSQILSGTDGRLERDLMPRFRSAFLATGDFDVRRDASMLFCALGLTSREDSARAEVELIGQIERLGTEPVGDSELQRAKRQVEARILFDWQLLRGRSLALAVHELVYRDAVSATAAVESIRAVTAADVQAAAEKWLSGRRRNVAWILPKAAPARSGGAR